MARSSDLKDRLLLEFFYSSIVYEHGDLSAVAVQSGSACEISQFAGKGKIERLRSIGN